MYVKNRIMNVIILVTSIKRSIIPREELEPLEKNLELKIRKQKNRKIRK